MAYSSNFTGAQIDEFTTKAHIIDLIYPVGSIYTSLNNTSPATLFGGTWTALNSCFLLGAGQPGTSDFGDVMQEPYKNYTVGQTGGESTHLLTIEEMPQHYHRIPGLQSILNTPQSVYLVVQGNDEGNCVLYKINSNGVVATWSVGVPQAPKASVYRGWTSSDNGISGPVLPHDGGTAHNNMPPYLSVYMWERTA